MATISQEALNKVITTIKPYINDHRANKTNKGPFVLGITGTQGSGKSTWAGAIQRGLTQDHKLKVIALSLDDLYFDHANLMRVREADTSNKLFRTRGQPGTHDEQLGAAFFHSLNEETGDILVPSFDKSKFNGEGDRAPQSEWEHVSREPPVDVLVFEGWCVGFRPISDELLEEKWSQAKEQADREGGTSRTNTLPNHELAHLKILNANLSRYCETFMGPQYFDFMVHLDTTELSNVYEWRIDQEHALLRARGTGMTDEQVVEFVRGYMPSYELYLDGLRTKLFFEGDSESEKKGQLRLTLDRGRTVVSLEKK